MRVGNVGLLAVLSLLCFAASAVIFILLWIQTITDPHVWYGGLFFLALGFFLERLGGVVVTDTNPPA